MSNPGHDDGAPPDEIKLDDVLREELGRIAAIRKAKAASGYPVDERDELLGLALSGGGIRSAAFNLGLMQSLANRGVLARVDYLSTVSGGGYSGSALTWFLSSAWRGDNRQRFGTAPDDHPLGRRSGGAKSDPGPNRRIDHIRRHGNYLRPTPKLWAGSAVALALQSISFTAFLWFFPLVALLLGIDWVGHRLTEIVGWPAVVAPTAVATGHAPGNEFPLHNPVVRVVGTGLLWMWAPATLFLLLWLFRFRWSSVFPFADRESRMYVERLNQQSWMGVWLVVCLACAAVALLPHAVEGIVGWLAAAGGPLGIATILYGLVGKAAIGGEAGSWRAMLQRLAMPLGAALLAYALVVAALYLPWRLEQSGIPHLWLLLAAGVLCVASVWTAFFAKLNHMSLHRFYRDRLMEAFLPDPFGEAGSSQGNGWRPALLADQARLAAMCDTDSLGPYHLLNTHVILTRSPDAAVRGRGGDSFLLSPLYSGCDCTRWVPTGKLVREGRVGREMMLSTAMAISGAAMNPQSGPAGEGLTRNTAVSFLMMLFNLRLGYWIVNPSFDHLRGCWAVLAKLGFLVGWKAADTRARFGYPGFPALLGRMHDERSSHLELSDGGHFENLGIYELIRRKVPLIIVGDAGEDHGHALSDLGSAVERVRVDFGVHMRFKDGERDLAWLLRGSDKEHKGPVGIGLELARRGYAVAEIEYPGRSKGYLIYVKPCMIRELPASVYAYRALNAEFPHQSTGDQFFDEAQFEAYRELGYALMENLLDDALAAAIACNTVTPTSDPGPLPSYADALGKLRGLMWRRELVALEAAE
jgi:hypothetical protein